MTPLVTQRGAAACPPTLTACLLPGLLRAPASGQQQPGGRLSTGGKERLWAQPWGH